MNVMKRPLFRQAGGPVAPQMAAPMAPPMPDPQMSPEMAMQMAQDVAAQQASGVGEQYAQNTMARLDAAETSEDVINALRGNDLPIQARYQELAQYVGEEDAAATPQSVLALVQPTLMMTEQGAMDSGIGELMRNVVGEIDMEVEGAPTDMGQGVGSLMMAGAAPQEPAMGVGQQPVANFRQGGAVQRFQVGGEASRLQQLYSEMLPVYQGVLGDQEEARRLSQAQILFDIADRAGAFAAGVDPRTGQSMAGLSPAQQLAAATTGLGAQIGQRMAGVEEQDRALRLAALQGAQSEYSAERAAARAAAGRERGIGTAFEIVGPDGQVIDIVRLRTQDDFDRVQEQYPDALIREQQAPREPVIREFNNNLVDLTDPENPRVILEGVADRDIREVGGNLLDITNPASPRIVYQAEPDRDIRTIGDSIVDITDPTSPQVVFEGPSQPEFRTVGDVLLNVSDPANPQIVYQGAQDRDLRTVDNRVIDFTDPQNPVTLYEPAPAAPSGNFVNVETADGQVISLREDDPQLDAAVAAGGRVVSRTGPSEPVAPLVDVALMERYGRGETTPQETALIESEIASTMQTPAFNPETQQFEAPAITNLVMNASRARAAAGLPTQLEVAERVAGEPTVITPEREAELVQAGRTAFGTMARIIDTGNAALSLFQLTPGPETEQAVTRIEALNQETLIAYRALTEGRVAQTAVEDFQRTQPTPAEIRTTPYRAKQQINGMIRFYEGAILDAQNTLDAGVVSAAEQQRLNTLITTAQRQIAEYRAVIQGINVALNGTDIDLDQFTGE